jgi:sulfite exporter TauE/SafE
MYWTAIIMGLAGSLHCAGMCSPLVLAATANGKGIRSRLVYNCGRILMYGILGAVLGSFGSLLPLDNFRHSITIALGIALLVLSIAGSNSIRVPLVHTHLSQVMIWFKGVFASVLKRRSMGATFLLGFLNGILPCGLTFAALVVAFSFGTWQSAAFMMVFGLGTLPVMVGFTSGLNYLMRRFNFSLARMASVLLFVSGSLLITRAFVQHHEETPLSHKHELVDIVLCR